jgi:Tfp pilus assembly protein PilZ
VSRLERPRRIPVAGARAQLAATVADVLNLSRTGVLVRTTRHQTPGSEAPLVLELSETAITVTARVVRCEAAAVPRHGGRRQYTLGLAFIDPPKALQHAIDEVCEREAEGHQRRPFFVSFVRRCPACRSRAVQKESKYHYGCSDCGHLFAGVRIGLVRIAR